MSIQQIGTNVYFDNNWLNSISGFMVLASNAFAPPQRTLASNIIANTNKSKTSAAFFTGKTITLNCAIALPSAYQAESSLDSLNAMLQGIEKDIILSISGLARRWTATLENSTVNSRQGGFIQFDIVFNCSDHFGYETALTNLVNVSSYSTATKSDTVTFGGTADWQVPIFTVTFTTVTGATGGIVALGNSGTGQTLTITRNWVNGDVLIVDVQNKTVKVNGTEIAWTGALPEFKKGSGIIAYSDNFSTRSINYKVDYYKRYL